MNEPITLEELYRGKPTKIKNAEYFPTKDYVDPFIQYMSKFTDNFVINAKLPDQITKTVHDKIDYDDVTYNRVWVQAVMPEEYMFDNHSEVVGFLYGLDVKKPVCKIYRGGMNMACTNLCVFSPEFLDLQPLDPSKALNYNPIKNLMEQTSDLKQWIKVLKETSWERDIPAMERNLGKWTRNTIEQSCDFGFGKVKLSTTNVVDAYKHLFIDKTSPYYIPEDHDVNMFTVYNAFTDLITNDGNKDIINKAEKTLLVKSILDF